MYLSHESAPREHQLVRYLLGLLSDDDAQRIEELSITDTEMAERLIVVEHDLVDAYVNGTLAETERVQFERWYLMSPLRCEKVRFAENLHARAVGGSTTVTVTPVPALPERIAPAAARGGWMPLCWLAVAATLLLGVSVALAFATIHFRDELNGAQTARAVTDTRAQDLAHELEIQRSIKANSSSRRMPCRPSRRRKARAPE
jgi:hypothetical protein